MLLSYCTELDLLSVSISQAITHPSYESAREQYEHFFLRLRERIGARTAATTLRGIGPTIPSGGMNGGDNQRLEFLGDAVLEFICSSHLFYMVM